MTEETRREQMKPTKISIVFKDLDQKTWTATAERRDADNFFVRGNGPVPDDDRDVVENGFRAGIKAVMEREEAAP